MYFYPIYIFFKCGQIWGIIIISGCNWEDPYQPNKQTIGSTKSLEISVFFTGSWDISGRLSCDKGPTHAWHQQHLILYSVPEEKTSSVFLRFCGWLYLFPGIIMSQFKKNSWDPWAMVAMMLWWDLMLFSCPLSQFHMWPSRKRPRGQGEKIKSDKVALLENIAPVLTSLGWNFPPFLQPIKIYCHNFWPFIDTNICFFFLFRVN